MNKHSSVFMLMLRGMLFPVLGVLALMAAVQTVLFQFTLSRAETYCLEELFYQSRISVICGIAFLLVTVWMGHLYRDSGGRQSLTVITCPARLSMSIHSRLHGVIPDTVNRTAARIHGTNPVSQNTGSFFLL